MKCKNKGIPKKNKEKENFQKLIKTLDSIWSDNNTKDSKNNGK